ncbi:MAG: pyrroline-5-carboxylate reductase [Clostridiales bacterium]|nr:pyrroline-5-carboxylate reductase [Clostridiales bacterium]
MIKDVNIGFIGFGNMAQALADGFLFKKVLLPSQIYACARNWDKLCVNTQVKGINACKTATELVNQSDVIIIAVKPQMIEEIIIPIKDILQGKIVVSIAAGYQFETYESLLLPGTSHISTMPNTPVSIGEGVIIAENQHSLSKEEYNLVDDLFSKIAILQLVGSNQLSIAGTISGCGPAFASMFIEALSDAAVKHGLPRDIAYKLSSQMVAGTGKLQVATGKHPGEIKDAVCSPGGSTIVGVTMLERKGFRSAVIDAIDAIEIK